jgi:aspartate racemase
MTKRIGLIGGMSWESTASYYALLNQFGAERDAAPWTQPRVLIDSVDFAEIVALQELGQWTETGRVLADAARRLEGAGATVLGICANTMHVNFDVVRDAVAVDVIDVRTCVANEVRALGADSVTVLGTRYLYELDFYVAHLRAAGLEVVTPSPEQIDELQRIVFSELTFGVVSEASRTRFVEIAESCRSRGGDVVGLCCTEFNLLVPVASAPWPVVDSTAAHVRGLLRA